MAVDTPARIAIIGAGPIGLEAALYARFLGYEVDVYERGQVADCVRSRDATAPLAPFRDLRSTLGLAALAAQDPNFQRPPDDATLTGRQWIERYLAPLAGTDLLADHLHTGTTVIAVRLATAEVLATHQSPGEFAESADAPETEILLELQRCDADGCQRAATANVVLDAGGVGSQPDWPSQDNAPDAANEPTGLLNPQTNCYVLGAKSYGDRPFQFRDGLEQIRRLFAILGGRDHLDLYSSVQNLVP